MSSAASAGGNHCSLYSENKGTSQGRKAGHQSCSSLLPSVSKRQQSLSFGAWELVLSTDSLTPQPPRGGQRGTGTATRPRGSTYARKSHRAEPGRETEEQRPWSAARGFLPLQQESQRTGNSSRSRKLSPACRPHPSGRVGRPQGTAEDGAEERQALPFWVCFSHVRPEGCSPEH